MPSGASLALGATALGAITGGQANKKELSINAGTAGALENQAGGISGDMLTQLQSLLGQGPGEDAVKQGVQGQQDFISQLQQALSSGGMPTQQDVTQSGQFAQQVFAPQQLAMQQQFQDQGTNAARQAAQLGRNVSDPILQAKLAQEQTRQSSMLNSQMGSFAAQQAQQLPFQRLNLGSQLMQAKSSLANQAFANRQALLQLGQAVQGQQQNFRVNTASRTETSGGGASGALAGGMAGLGMGISPEFGKFASNFGDFFGGTTTKTPPSIMPSAGE